MTQRPAGHVSRSLYQAHWFTFGTWLASILPRPFLRGLAGAAGWSYAYLAQRRSSVVRQNLALVAPAPVTSRQTRAVYAHFGQTLADYFYLGSRPREQAAWLIEEKIGYENLRAAAEMKKGVLLLTAHLGFFELGGFVMNQLGFPTLALTLPETNEALTRWRTEYRRRWGVETLEVGRDPFVFNNIRQELTRGKFVVALIDRPSGSYDVPVKMPNGTLRAAGGILHLASLIGCPVVTVSVVVKQNGRYRLEAHPPLLPASHLTIPQFTQNVMDQLTPTISAHFTQWFQFAPL